MSYYLSRRAVLKWLEVPTVYHIAKDELYELDDDSFRFMKNCAMDDGCSSKDGAFIDYCMEEGLLTTEKVHLHRPALVQSPKPSLRYLELQITSACNLRCKHCYIGDAPHQELSVRDIRSALAQFEEMQGLRVLISGGEPLVHGAFPEINEMLPDFFLRKVLFTNGVLLDREMLKSLKVDEIQISIDGLEAGHDALRGRGMFEQSLRAARQALDAGFDVSISTMVHAANLDDFDELEKMFKSMEIKDWTVDVPCAAGRLTRHQELLIGPREGGKFLGYGFGGGLHSSRRGFGCGLHLAAVTAAGEIAKCTFYGDLPAGSLGRGLLPVWNTMPRVRLAGLSCSCDYIDVCRGGCRYRAELLEGTGGKDRYRCVLYGIL